MPGLDLPSENDLDPETDEFYHPFQAKARTYRHFDLPLSDQQRSMTRDFSTEEEKHRFLPLLGFTDIRRRVVREGGKPRVKEKPRPIRFAGHADSAYLQAYAEFLAPRYEASILLDGTSDSVLAYRKGGRTNIHHAKSLFEEIRCRENCLVLAIDISGFFDCLDHRHLKSELCGILNATQLTGHHWTVFRALTRYSWVEVEDLDALLGKRRKRMGRVCSPEDFTGKVRGRSNGLIRTHDLNHGIPQGTPVSGLYANIYLRSFDKEVLRYVRARGGSYRRYSDDIAIVLPIGSDPREIVSVIEKYLADYSLSLSPDKTEISRFSAPPLKADHPIQYLGCTFDGQKIRIRDSSMDAFRKKMRRGIHAKLVAAKKKRVPSNLVFRREVLSRYTHLGKRRNFLRYAYRAAEILDAGEIRLQVKRHVTWFNRAWRQEVVRVYGGLIE